MKNRIELLPLEVAEQISAGEVIERPLNIVKECIENSIDAGATIISISAVSGGKQSIEIVDNGSGIAVDDLALAPVRHATSKLRVFNDLEKLKTLGFRGEALASLNAVSRLEILSQTKDQDEAYSWTSEGIFKRGKQTFLGSPHGTVIQIKDLFYNVPARLKFLKSDSAEFSALRDYIERIAFSYPAIQFILYKNTELSLDLEATDAEGRVKQLVNHLDSTLQVLEKSDGEYQLKVYWMSGMSLPHSKRIFSSLNGRTLKDKLISQAIQGAFKQFLLPGQYPAIFLELTAPLSEVDINVHPMKLEVRFQKSSWLFGWIEKNLSEMIRAKGFYQTHGAVNLRSEFTSSTPTFSAGDWRSSEHTPSISESSDDRPLASLNLNSEMPSPGLRIQPSLQLKKNVFGRYVGCVFKTYLIFEDDSLVTWVDQHAAHERVRYEALKRSHESALTNQHRQNLLFPVPTRVSQTDKSSKIVDLLNHFGFEAELQSGDSLWIRSLPVLWLGGDLALRLQALVTRIEDYFTESETQNPEKLFQDERLFEKMASEACHSAIRAGDSILPEQAEALIQQLLTCDNPWNCPHGRPTITRMHASKLDQWFQRIVPKNSNLESQF